ncbi:helix-turn-helix domain-containing protein [Mucilaginibacter litoreus]|uniref:Helix-turn-helix domain-containing protein n=1 Tax=Mucilaginibacter litoreus TaxID=1048221 RepID=A0ABW3APJ6_9SPHI
METLQTGRFYGQTSQTLQFDFATITDTEYTHDRVDWHYHENAYFTFILQGNVIEGNRKEVYNCSAGSLLFHNWHDAHYNIKPKGYTRGFHVELHEHWFKNTGLNFSNLQGSFAVADPKSHLLFYNLFRESKGRDGMSSAPIEALLLQALADISAPEKYKVKQKPLWAEKLKQVLHDDISQKFTLQQLAEIADVHPVHLSRDFPKYFNTNFGDYVRALRIEKAFTLMHDTKLSLTEIALSCGFADQSHFLRCFKQFNNCKPSLYRQLLFS